MSHIVNGVELDSLTGLVNAIKEDPQVAKVSFQAQSVWKGGTKAEVTISEIFSNENNIMNPNRKYTLVVDEPGVLGGTDESPNPVEYLAAALCGCLTAGIATNAAMFNTELEKIDVQVKVNFDVRGLFGMDRSIASGPLNLHYKVKLKGKNGATKEQLQKSKETLDKKSPVKNTIELPLKVTTEFEYEE